MTSRKPMIGPVFLMVVIITMVLPSGALAQAFYMPPRHHGITQDNIVPGEIIVKLKKDRGKPLIKEEEKNGSIETNFPSLNTLNKKFGARSIRRLHQGWNKPTKKRLPSRAQAMRKDLGSVYAIRLGNHTNLSAALAEYKKDENVEYAEPNYLAFTTATIPNDPEFSKQWALNNTGQTGGTADADIDAPEAWDISTASPDAVIAVVDTGVDWDHPDLASNIWTNEGEIAGDTIDNDGNGYVDDVRGWDFVTVEPDDVFAGEDPGPPDNDPMDAHGHGTHCSGIVGAVANNGVGIAGINWHGKIMAVRAGYKSSTGRGSLEESDIAAGIIYATDNGADIINMSFGGDTSETMKSAIDYANAAGVVLIASAGNDGCKCIQYPAAYDCVLAVSSFDHNDLKASSSSFGSWIEVAAPGVSIYSTYVNDSYVFMSGTSMAAPQVCGVAGLLLSRNPTYTPQEIRQVLRVSSDDVSSPGWDEESGYGRINAFNALTVNSVCSAQIDTPTLHEAVEGIVDIAGTAAGTNFNYYDLYYGEDENPTTWNPIGETSYSEVTNGVLTSWDVSTLPDGYYTLKLVVVDTDLHQFIDRKVVMVKNVTVDIFPPLYKGVFRSGSVIQFSGTIKAVNFQDYQIEFGVGTSPADWTAAGITLADNGSEEVINGAIGSWDTGIWSLEGEFTIRVTVQYGTTLEKIEYYPVYFDPTIKEGWPKTVNNVGPVTLGYLGDAIDGKVLASTNTLSEESHQTNAWNYNGTEVPGWPAMQAANHFATIATGDVDRDGKNEAVIGYSWNESAVYILKPDGTLAQNWPQEGQSSDIYEGVPVLSDIDRDGDLEVFVGGSKAFSWHHDGTPVEGWPKDFEGSSPAVADITGDGYVELVIVSLDQLYVFDRFGTEVPGFPVALEDETYHPPVIGDIDNDGAPDIIVAVTDAKKIYVFENDGSVKVGWPRSYYGYPPNYGIALGDINADGYLELFLASSSRINAWNYQGNSLPGWPVYLPDVLWIGGNAAPVLGDINGDNAIEMVIGADAFEESYEKVFAYNALGQPVAGWPKLVRPVPGYGIMSSPSLGDLDNDGDIDLVVSSNADSEMETDVYVWDVPSAYNQATIAWGMFAHDEWHTGAYGDQIPPMASAFPPGGIIDSFKTVTLAANEQSFIYYTTDGTIPTVSSALYTAPLMIAQSTVLTFVAVDASGNQGVVRTEIYLADFDSDGVQSEEDNCPLTPNGPLVGTCTAGSTDKLARPCMQDATCGLDGFCSMNQEDTYPPGGDGIGDACFICEADFDCDRDVDGSDASTFRADFGRSLFSRRCSTEDPCNGDFTCDGDVDGSDATAFKQDFGRSQFHNPCPQYEAGAWCVYP